MVYRSLGLAVSPRVRFLQKEQKRQQALLIKQNQLQEKQADNKVKKTELAKMEEDEEQFLVPKTKLLQNEIKSEQSGGSESNSSGESESSEGSESDESENADSKKSELKVIIGCKNEDKSEKQTMNTKDKDRKVTTSKGREEGRGLISVLGMRRKIYSQ